MDRGTIFNIQKFSVHDGPGIRTTVFLKGCPLNCWWCHNPESQSPNQEIMFFQTRCVGCGNCLLNCSNNALLMKDGKIDTDLDKCTLCGECLRACPVGAREMVGKIVSISEVMKEIKKDLIFYDESGGGVTFSGGEPLVQLEYLKKLLDSCKQEEIHTVVDTSGYVTWERFRVILPQVDLFLYDLKLMDNERHKKFIGVSNDMILDNLEKLSETNQEIFVRIPIIPGINDDIENINQTGKFLAKLNITQVNLLPYHNTGIDKYHRLGVAYELMGIKSPSKEKMIELSEALTRFGLKIKIGG